MKLYWLKIDDKIDTQGQSKGPVIWLRPDAPSGVLEHEEMHVAFWYAITLLSIPVLWFIYPSLVMLAPVIETMLSNWCKPYKVIKESFGYAREATRKQNPELYLVALEKSRLHADKYGDDFVTKVRKRMRWFE